MPFRTQLARGQPVLERRVRVEQASGLHVIGLQEALDVDGGDLRALLVDDGLALDDAGNDHRLVDGEALAVIASRISGVSASPNCCSSFCATANGAAFAPLISYSTVSGGM